MELAIGTRVRVRSDPDFGPGPWPAQPTGRIGAGPDEVQGRDGVMRTYWIEFDEPQFDTDGSGPYRSSQVLEKYLQAIE